MTNQPETWNMKLETVMNLQQLEYIIAVDTHRHFATAAEHCFVTQPTLSMMIQKLEDELGLKIFDRSRQPVEPTPEGKKIISRARHILVQTNELKSFAREQTHETNGELRLAVIPTLAPYILPYFLGKMSERYPKLSITVREANTLQIIEMLKHGQTDVGLLSTPLNEAQIKEYPLFYEELLAYTDVPQRHSKLVPADLDPDKLWLLEEGHCFRAQVLNYCELRKNAKTKPNLVYEAGSIQTLINMVDGQGGTTIVPQLATLSLNAAQKKKLQRFTAPAPVREVSLVTHLHFSRNKILEALKAEILDNVPIKNMKEKKVLEI